MALVGHETMHSPHDTQLELPISSFRSKLMPAFAPLPVRPMTRFCCTSSQARMQRAQRMHAPWSTWKTVDEVSLLRRPTNGFAGGGGAESTSCFKRCGCAPQRLASTPRSDRKSVGEGKGGR